MSKLLLFMAFATQPAPASDIPARDPRAPTVKINILLKQPAPICEAQSAEEIVVCADKTDNESQRLRPIANAHKYDEDESKAQLSISENVRMAAEVDSNLLGGGIVSKSVMARVKIAF